MWLMFIVSTEFTIFSLYVLNARYYLYLLLLLLYLVFWYYSGAEETGNDSKPLFRSWCLWKRFTAVQYIWANKEELNIKNRTYLFIVLPNATNMALISGFGFYGPNVFPRDFEVSYILPALLFKIPVVREVLLWSGACCAPNNKDVEGTILRLLRKGKSVAYCPTGMKDYFSNENNNNNDDFELDPAIFQFAFSNKIYIVPVLVDKELERYSVSRSDQTYVRKLQKIAFNRWGIPIPLLIVPKIFGQGPPPKMVLSIGTTCDPTVFDDAGSFKRLCEGQIKGLI